MSEAIYPALLHQDSRYFRRGIGNTRSRLGHSVAQVFWTHTDFDRTQFNYSEVLGNSTVVAISNAYYQDNQSATNSATKLGMQMGVDSVERSKGILAQRKPEALQENRQ